VQKKFEDGYFSLMIKHIFKKPVFNSQTQNPVCPNKQAIGATPDFSHFRFFCRFNKNSQSCWNLQRFIYKKIALIQMVTKIGHKIAVKLTSSECTIFKKNGLAASPF
jgi:ribosomal protein S1